MRDRLSRIRPKTNQVCLEWFIDVLRRLFHNNGYIMADFVCMCVCSCSIMKKIGDILTWINQSNSIQYFACDSNAQWKKNPKWTKIKIMAVSYSLLTSNHFCCCCCCICGGMPIAPIRMKIMIDSQQIGEWDGDWLDVYVLWGVLEGIGFYWHEMRSGLLVHDH